MTSGLSEQHLFGLDQGPWRQLSAVALAFPPNLSLFLQNLIQLIPMSPDIYQKAAAEATTVGPTDYEPEINQIVDVRASERLRWRNSPQAAPPGGKDRQH